MSEGEMQKKMREACANASVAINAILNTLDGIEEMSDNITELQNAVNSMESYYQYYSGYAEGMKEARNIYRGKTS